MMKDLIKLTIQQNEGSGALVQHISHGAHRLQRTCG